MSHSKIYPWFGSQWSAWLNQNQADQFPNALLLTGPAGIGKHELAVRLSSLLLCAAPTPEPCGQCKNCRLFLAGTHPDFMAVLPEEGSKSIKIDQIRGLSDFIHGRPQVGQRLVVIVNPAEAMNLYSANAILKTLEEPPAGAVIILVSPQASMLLPTIRSRCQIIKLVSPQVEESIGWLAQETGMDHEQNLQLIRTAAGQPLTAKKWHEESRSDLYQDVMAAWLDYLEGKKDAFSVAEKWAKEDIEWIVNWLAQWIKDALLIKLDAGEVDSLLQPVATKLGYDCLWQLYQSLIEAKRGIAEQRNLNPQLVFENWLLMNKRKYAN